MTHKLLRKTPQSTLMHCPVIELALFEVKKSINLLHLASGSLPSADCSLVKLARKLEIFPLAGENFDFRAFSNL